MKKLLNTVAGFEPADVNLAVNCTSYQLGKIGFIYSYGTAHV